MSGDEPLTGFAAAPLILFSRVSGDEPEIKYSLDPTALFFQHERG